MKLSLLLAVLLAAALPSGCEAKPSPERLKRAVVTLSKAPYGPFTYPSCTGVAVGPHVVLTARHCANGHIPYVNGKRSDQDVVFAVDTDNVLLWTKQKYKHWVNMAHYAPKVGQEVQQYGHPGGAPLMYRRGYMAGTVVDEHLYPGSLMYVFDMNNAGGDSGGPIYDWKGQVICVVSQTMAVYGFSGFSMTACYPTKFTTEELKWLKSPTPPRKLESIQVPLASPPAPELIQGRHRGVR